MAYIRVFEVSLQHSNSIPQSTLSSIILLYLKMQFKYLLLAITAHSAATTALKTLTLEDGTPIDVDPAKVLDAFDPNNADTDTELSKRSPNPAANSAKIVARMTVSGLERTGHLSEAATQLWMFSAPLLPSFDHPFM